MRIAYICNGKNPKCMNEAWCRYNGKQDGCDHTENVEYARYGGCDEHPEWYPERFFKRLDNADDWWEKNH